MSAIVFFAVIFAALLHASWNALLKGGEDKMAGMAGVVLGSVPPALIALCFVPAPTPEAYPYLAVGIALHICYQLFLLHAYRIGDLTQVYPLARGSAPLIVAVISVAFLGVVLSGMELLAIAVIVIGIFSLTVTTRGAGNLHLKPALLALGTGVFIASYSLVDGYGARAGGTGVGYYAWLSIGNAVLFSAYLALTSPQALRGVMTAGRRSLLIGGPASFIAYAIVTWSFTQAPIALVTALRETSIVFALLIGVFVMGERLSLGKLLSTIAVVTGAILLRFVRP